MTTNTGLGRQRSRSFGVSDHEPAIGVGFPKTIIKFDNAEELTAGPIRRVSGLVRARNLFQVLDAIDLDFASHLAKSSWLIGDILDSLDADPEMFPVKNRGVVLGCSNFAALQRSRYQLSFQESRISSVLDGAHTMLALGTFILIKALNDPEVRSRIRLWSDFRRLWSEHREQLELLRLYGEGPDAGVLDLRLPVEIMAPRVHDDETSVNAFMDCLPAVFAARASGVRPAPVPSVAGSYPHDVLREVLPAGIAARIEWDAANGKDVLLRDVVALAWIPLSVLDLPEGSKPSPQTVCGDRAECVRLFGELAHSAVVSDMPAGGGSMTLETRAFRSALALAGQMPELYEKIYEMFPAAYREAGGRLGGFEAVASPGSLAIKPTSRFTGRPIDFNYPDGLILPLVHGLSELVRRDEKGLVCWSENPDEFLDRHIVAIVRKYRFLIEALERDPRRICRSEGVHELVRDAYRAELPRPVPMRPDY